MKERIIEFLKAENKTSAQFAEEIGVQPSGISHILSGRNKPSLDFVLKMLEKYNYLSTGWLLFGKGDMYNKTSFPDLFSQPQDKGSDHVKPGEQIAPEQEPVHDHKYIKDIINEDTEKPSVEKIVWFFNDNTFREYLPPGK